MTRLPQPIARSKSDGRDDPIDPSANPMKSHKSHNHQARYGALSIAFHWGMAVLLLTVYLSMELSGSFPRGSDARSILRTVHYVLGMTVLPLAALRLAINRWSEKPLIVPAPPVWQERIAVAVRIALYALMIGLPLLGWLLLSAEGQTVRLFGLHLPALIAKDAQAADVIKPIHESGATLGYLLVGLHAAAALLHHSIQRDDTLRRMLPGRRYPTAERKA